LKVKRHLDQPNLSQDHLSKEISNLYLNKMQARQTQRYSTQRRRSNNTLQPPRNPRKRPTEFEEIPGAAFFIGKLNKNHNRDQIYNALRILATKYRFYIRRLDMPYGNKQTKYGNPGYCFVHCKSKQEADRVVALKYIHLLNQRCEVKAYGGRDFVNETEESLSAGADFVNQYGGGKLASVSECSQISSQMESGYATPIAQPEQKSVEEDLMKVLRQKYTDDTRVPAWEQQNQSFEKEPLDGEISDVESGIQEKMVGVAKLECHKPDVKVTVQSKLEVNTEEGQSSIENDVAEILGAFDPLILNRYLRQCLIEAQSQGTTQEFLQMYSQAYQNAQMKVQTMSSFELIECARQYPSLGNTV
jgi:hypothetical protein